ncbi:MAG: hypothetical protein U0232_33290 [Thermomicrobiales bacterium]
METAAARYAAMVVARDAQTARLFTPADGDRWDQAVGRFRDDPRRTPDRNLAAVMEYVEPGDTVVDVGGGAGRMALPMALKCSDVVNVDPSAAMCAEFDAIAWDAGIANARAVRSPWMEADGIEGDVVLAFNVAYFVAGIVPFVEKLAKAARRRVIVNGWSVPPPNQDAALFEVALGEPLALLPGPMELVPVLWEMGILPDVRVLDGRFALHPPPPTSRETALETALLALRRYDRLSPESFARARESIENGLDRLFRIEGEAWVPTWRPAAREFLITWETGRAAG